MKNVEKNVELENVSLSYERLQFKYDQFYNMEPLIYVTIMRINTSHISKHSKNR